MLGGFAMTNSMQFILSRGKAAQSGEGMLLVSPSAACISRIISRSAWSVHGHALAFVGADRNKIVTMIVMAIANSGFIFCFSMLS